ncbi:threonine-phosphate decarboxylase [Pseudonocardiaceae bacterium YIM PH 21723]|nr:threonine-phosphate decarboxylase [Pseudonocardiaceae bacterium YIM PH 21723]
MPVVDERAALRHHGDAETAPGLADFAVNVRADGPPPWLRKRLRETLDELGTYPSADRDLQARAQVARRHGCEPDEVLILNGAAEAFALLPRLNPTHAVVVHPGFTEPEVALTDAGIRTTRVLLDEADGFTLHPEHVPPDADLVVIGNPTNPTSVLHPRHTLRALERPGRLVVVDEAFLDAVPGEPESMIGSPGVLVLRSLTKTWSLPGLRAGYAIGDAETLQDLARSRPQWPVGTLTLEAVRACCEPDAVAEAAEGAAALAEQATLLVAELSRLPGCTVFQPSGPFLLVRLPGAASIRVRLRERGFAVRRCDTFPGLTDDHLRIAVRPAEQAKPLIDALRTLVEAG